MRRLVLVVTAGSLMTLSAAGAAFAAGPDPAGNNPWDACTAANGGAPTCVSHTNVIGDAQACETNSGAPGHWLWNSKSWKAHCFGN